MYIENHLFTSMYATPIQQYTGFILAFSLSAMLKMPPVCNQSPISVVVLFPWQTPFSRYTGLCPVLGSHFHPATWSPSSVCLGSDTPHPSCQERMSSSPYVGSNFPHWAVTPCLHVDIPFNSSGVQPPCQATPPMWTPSSLCSGCQSISNDSEQILKLSFLQTLQNWV